MSFTEINPHLNRIFAYLDLAQKKGAFTIKQSSDIYQQVTAIQTLFNQATDRTNQAIGHPSHAGNKYMASKSVSFADQPMKGKKFGN